MKSIIKNVILTLVLLIFMLNINIVINSTKEATLLFLNKIFISIFPFIILCDILIYFDYHIFLKRIFGKFLSKIFNIDSSCSIIFILSLLTSSPANSIYIKSMLDKKQIDIETANKILNFTYFPSISFTIGTIGILMYKSFKFGLFLWLFCLLNNILIGIFMRKENTTTFDIIDERKINFFEVLKKSFIKGIKTSITILGNLIIFTIILNIINKYFTFNKVFYSIFSGFIELTSGITYVNKLNISLIYKFILTFFILSFNSLSVIFQSLSILSNYKINIKKTLIVKLMFSLILSILMILIKDWLSLIIL